MTPVYPLDHSSKCLQGSNRCLWRHSFRHCACREALQQAARFSNSYYPFHRLFQTLPSTLPAPDPPLCDLLLTFCLPYIQWPALSIFIYVIIKVSCNPSDQNWNRLIQNYGLTFNLPIPYTYPNLVGKGIQLIRNHCYNNIA